jgi:molybdopterin/thiamine biosynthesis adenylyltransferase
MSDAYLPLLFSCRNERHVADFQLLTKSESPRLIDLFDQQLDELILCRNPLMNSSEISQNNRIEQLNAPLELSGNWVYYPWINTAVRILEVADFIEVRTNRNRNKVTAKQQAILSQKKIGIAGLSVGRSLAMTLVSQRLLGEIVLADYDRLELSNLNRIKAPLTDTGVLKTVSAAREIALIDPYIKVYCLNDGLQEDNFDEFFSSGGRPIDLFVEECDSLAIKLRSRVEARKRRIPVVMEASDRCLVDIERFDLEPDRPILHGIVDDKEIENVGSLKSFEDKLPLLSKLVDVNNLSEGMKASVQEIGKSLRTWPQLASDVNYGSGVMAKLIQAILLDEIQLSGRFHIDFNPKLLLREE